MNLFRKFYGLREAFRACFDDGKWFKSDGQLSEHAEIVMRELKQFCHADASCVVVAKDGRIDTHATIYAEGQRSVLHKIQAYLHLSDEQLMRLRTPEEVDDE